MILQGAVQLVFGADIVNLDLPVPRFNFAIGGLRISSYDLAVLTVTLVVVSGLFLIIERTRLGVTSSSNRRAVGQSAFSTANRPRK